MARLFDDANPDRLAVSAAPITAAPCTLACWFRMNADTNSFCITVGDNGDLTNNDKFALRVLSTSNGGVVRATAQDGAGEVSADTSTGRTIGTWHHGGAVFTSATARAAFIDGGSKGTDTNSKTPANLDAMEIGGRLNAEGQDMSGDIAEVVIWNDALTDAEMAALATGVMPRSIRNANLKGYWSLWGLHSPEIDLSGFGNNLTVTTATKSNHAPVTLFTPKWAASVPLIEVAAPVGAGIRNPFGGPMVLRNPLGA